MTDESIQLGTEEKCDRCGPGTMAKFMVKLAGGGYLTLCTHCRDRHLPALSSQGALFAALY